MELRRFGATEREVSVIGQGTWYIESGHRGSVMAALRKGLDLGMNHIDAAELYGAGTAEEIVGEAIEGRRDDVFLVSKVLPQNASRSGTIKACERSLTRLRTDYLDCYLLHWRGSEPLTETIDAFEQLQTDGKILSWGVSNFDVPDLEEVREIADDLVCDQVLYHLEERMIEQRVIPWCAENDVAVVAYSPFGHGQFPDSSTPGGRVLQEIATAHNATPRQVALRFLVRHSNVFAIPKASNPEHTMENAGAGNLRLGPEEIAQIDRAFPLRPKRELPML
jgi:diketogulonate reductase-like aldo/keto reductase